MVVAIQMYVGSCRRSHQYSVDLKGSHCKVGSGRISVVVCLNVSFRLKYRGEIEQVVTCRWGQVDVSVRVGDFYSAGDTRYVGVQ